MLAGFGIGGVQEAGGECYEGDEAIEHGKRWFA
jgi:hypothetical protein